MYWLGPRAAHVTLADGTALPLPRPLAVAPGTQVTYGIRPQTISLGGDLAANVVLVEPTGETVDAQLNLGGTDLVAILPETARLKAGDRVALAFETARVLVFDPATGARLI